MIHEIYRIDLTILRLLNGGLASPTMDTVMLALSSSWMWLPFCIALIYRLYRNRRWDWLRLCLVAVVLIIVIDYCSYEFLKPWFSRLRPCKTWDFVRVVAGCGGWDSFPSNHATNSAVAAYVLWRYAGRVIGSVAAVLCILVCASRVYLGVHYPTDVIAGATLGASFALVSLRLLELRIVLPPARV